MFSQKEKFSFDSWLLIMDLFLKNNEYVKYSFDKSQSYGC